MSISLSDYVSKVINDPKYGSDIEWVKLNLQRAHLESIESTYLAERLAEGESKEYYCTSHWHTWSKKPEMHMEICSFVKERRAPGKWYKTRYPEESDEY